MLENLQTQMRCGNKIENKEYRSHLILEIMSSSICRFYSFIEQIFSNRNFEVFLLSSRNAMILKMQNNKNVYYFDRTIFHSNSAISEQMMELSSVGLKPLWLG